MAPMVEGMCVGEIFNDFRTLWRKMTNHHQLRWIGPEKGLLHISTAGIINALWDLWGKLEGKPVWRLLCDLSPEQLVKCCDFRYVTDFLTEKEALKILKDKWGSRAKRIKSIEKVGFPGYTTGCSWSGYSDKVVTDLIKKAKKDGFNAFKVKVGLGVEWDNKRLAFIRK